MYIDQLKELYYRERLKLEGMEVYRKESELRFLKLKADILQESQNRLSISELEGRADINEEVKDELLRDRDKQEKVVERIEDNLEGERQELEKEEKYQLERLGYSPDDFADYLCLAEKVLLLENALEEEKLFPSEVYREMKRKSSQLPGSRNVSS